jgi:hypothetical protein
MRRLTLFLSILCLVSGLATAETAFDPLQALADFTSPEAPAALYDINLGDAAAELFLQGGWTTGIAGYLSFDSQGGTGATVGLAGFSQKPWYNEVDFLLSLWINRHFFFEVKLGNGFKLEETAVLPGLKMSSFSLGYADRTVPGLNLVQIANIGIGIPEAGVLGFGSARDGVPGVLAAWSGTQSRHWAMLRLANRSAVVQRFRGTTPLLDLETSAGAWLRGQFFQLPYDHLSALRVWIESDAGTTASDGHRYRALEARDLLFVDLDHGRFGLKSPAFGRVAVEADTAAASAPVDFPALDRSGGLSAADVLAFGSAGFQARVLDPLRQRFLGDPAGLSLTVGAATAWLAYDPGRFSLFEDCAWYAKPQGLNPNRVGIAGGSTILTVDPLDDSLHIAAADGGGILVRYPLLSDPAANDPYLPGSQSSSLPRLIWQGSGAEATSTGLVLNGDPVAESIQVVRGGRPESGFSWDPESKRLIFLTPIQDGEDIVVSYDTESQESSPRSVQFAQSNRIMLADWLPLNAAVGLDWPLDAAANAAAGTGKLAAGVDAKAAIPETGLTLGARLAGRLSFPGVSGDLILQDFSGGSLTINPGRGNLLPSYPVSWLQATGLGLANRGRLVWRDFHSSGTWLAWDSSAPVADDFAAGHGTGPYAAGASGTDPFSGELAVAEYRMDPDRQWVSWEIRLSPEQRAALAGTASIGWRMRSIAEAGGGLRLWLEGGELAEDIDGSGSPSNGTEGGYGLPFQDLASGFALTAAPGWQNRTGAVLSEDADGNGRLDGERDTLVLDASRQYGAGLAVADGDSGWQQVSLVLGDDDRRKLQRAGAIRVILRKENAAATATGRILWGDIRVDQMGMAVENRMGSVAASVRTGSAQSVQQDLAAAFPSADGTGRAAYAEAAWTATGPGSFDLVQAVEAVDFARYDLLRFYLRLEEQAGADAILSVRLGDSASGIASQALGLATLPVGKWCRAVLDLRSGRLEISDAGGTLLAAAACPVSGRPVAYAAIRLAIGCDGPGNGRLLVDGIQASGGVPGLTGSGGLSLDWTMDGVHLATGGFPWLAGIRLRQDLGLSAAVDTVSHAGFPSGASGQLSWSGLAGLTLASVDVEAGISLSAGAGGYGGIFSYRLAFPQGISSPVAVSDSFSTELGNASPILTKGSGVDVDLGPAGRLSLAADVSRSEGRLSQNWKAISDLLPGLPFSQSGGFSLSQLSMENFGSGWQSAGLFDRIGEGYARYLPDESLPAIRRGQDLNNRFSLALEPLTLTLEQSLGSQSSLAAALPHRTRIGFKTAFDLADKASGWAASLGYSREANLSSATPSTGLADEIARGWRDIGAAMSTWAVWPVWELFDPAPAFLAESLAWPGASVMPRAAFTLVRPLAADIPTQLLPKRLETSITRLIRQNGGGTDDGLLFSARLDWLLLNLAGRNAATPAFGFYGSDQIGFRAGAGVWQQDGAPKAWQFQADFDLSLFALSPLDAAVPGQAPPVRAASRKDLLDLPPPDQAALKAGWYHREGALAQDALRATVDWSWVISLPDLKLDFLPVLPSHAPYLQNTESLAFNWAQVAGATDKDSSPLLQFFNFSSDGEFMTSSGLSASLLHRSVMILPDIAYISIILGYGLQYDRASDLAIHAIQCGIEARVVF